MLVSHSTRDTRVRVLWQFIDDLQRALDNAAVPIHLINVVSECGTKEVSGLPTELANATAATDLTMMVLTRSYVDSPWCEDEMHARARSACEACPSHRLFPLAWRTYPWPELWSRTIEGWGVDLQDLITDSLLDEVEIHLWEPDVRPNGWRLAIERTVAALSCFCDEINSTCTEATCPARVAPATPVPRRLD